MKHNRFLTFVMLLALASSIFAPGSAAQAATFVAAPWAHFQETATGNGSYVTGPGTPPLGTGSLQMIINGTGGY